jgi:hypothetical protein
MAVLNKVTSALVSILTTIGDGEDARHTAIIRSVPEVFVTTKEELIAIPVTSGVRILFEMENVYHVVCLILVKRQLSNRIYDCIYTRMFESDEEVSSESIACVTYLSGTGTGCFLTGLRSSKEPIACVDNKLIVKSLTLTHDDVSSLLNLSWITTVRNSETGDYDYLNKTDMAIRFDDFIYDKDCV